MERGTTILPAASLRRAEPGVHHIHDRVRKHLLIGSALLLQLASDLSPIAELMPALKHIFLIVIFFK